MKKKQVLASLVVAVAGGAVLVGCGSKLAEPFHDADRSKVVNSGPADVIEMPDGFSNSATKCDHGNRIYVLFKSDGNYGSIAVVPGDPTCAHG